MAQAHVKERTRNPLRRILSVDQLIPIDYPFLVLRDICNTLALRAVLCVTGLQLQLLCSIRIAQHPVSSRPAFSSANVSRAAMPQLLGQTAFLVAPSRQKTTRSGLLALRCTYSLGGVYVAVYP